jgi:hypothetical protein
MVDGRRNELMFATPPPMVPKQFYPADKLGNMGYLLGESFVFADHPAMASVQQLSLEKIQQVFTPLLG